MTDRSIPPPAAAPPHPPIGPGGILRLAAGLVVVLVGVALLRWGGAIPAVDAPTATGQIEPETAERVALEFAGPDGSRNATEVPWTPGMTVRDATDAARPADWRGTAEMAFLDSLGGVENEGSGGLNWQFEVNGDYADRGAGAYELSPGDRVLWKFAPYE